MFILGLIASAFLSEFITVIHEIIKEKGGMDYEIYRLAILFVSPVFFTYIGWLIYKDFIKPLNKIEKQLKKLQKIKTPRSYWANRRESLVPSPTSR